jgi:kumamolisin
MGAAMPNPSPSPKIPSGYRRLPGSERSAAPDAELIGPVPASDPVHVTVVLRRRPDSPAVPDPSYYLNTPPSRRRRLSEGEFAERYGAAEDDIARVRDFANRNNLEVTEVSAARRMVELSGTVEQFSRAFAVALNQYRRPAQPGQRREEADTEVYRGREGFIYVPAALVEIIVGVFGLDNRSVSHRNAADPPNTNPVPLTQITQLYDFPANQAIGQTIAIFSLGGSQGGYLPSDISSNFGGNPPVVTDVPVNASNGNFAAPETTQDIVISASVAPGADVAVYFNDGTQQGWVTTVGRVVHPQAGDPVCSVLSSSWYIRNGDDSALSSGTTAALITAVSQAFEDAAIQGVTVCIASGDTGSESKIPDGKAHVQYPGSDPWVLSCGGTAIGSVSGTSFDEWVWNDAWGATGGGVSAIFPLPWYQVDAGVPGSVNDGHHGRGVPDVAANASGASGYPIIVGGSPFPGNGTSASAPLWAGLIAVLNATLNENIGFVNPVLYALGSSIFRDIVAEPGATDNSRFGTPGYPAGPGWDACTGWGTPKGKALLAGLHGFYGPAIAVNLQDDLDFGVACRGPGYRTVHVYNVGNRDLMILSAQRVSGSGDFTVLSAPATPLAIAPGAGIDFTIEYHPAAPGTTATATIQITSNDPVNPTLDLAAHGASGAGKLAVTGSTYFGGVRACCYEERTIWIANVGDCAVHVADVAFSHPAKAWKLVNNAFPATLHPGASLAVVIRYHAIERYARVRELIVTSDDPHMPARELEVLAHTIWDEQCRDDCAKGYCRKRGRCAPSSRSYERCLDEDNDQDRDQD